MRWALALHLPCLSWVPFIEYRFQRVKDFKYKILNEGLFAKSLCILWMKHIYWISGGNEAANDFYSLPVGRKCFLLLNNWGILFFWIFASEIIAVQNRETQKEKEAASKEKRLTRVNRYWLFGFLIIISNSFYERKKIQYTAPRAYTILMLCNWFLDYNVFSVFRAKSPKSKALSRDKSS